MRNVQLIVATEASSLWANRSLLAATCNSTKKLRAVTPKAVRTGWSWARSSR